METIDWRKQTLVFDGILKINVHFLVMIMEEVLLEVDAEIFKDEMEKCWDWFQNNSVERSISKAARDSRHCSGSRGFISQLVGILEIFQCKIFF